MNRLALIAILALIWVAAPPPPTSAQDVTADVTTWSGQSWRLSQPSLEIFYSIVSAPQEETGDKGSSAMDKITTFTNLTLGGLRRDGADPSIVTLNRFFGKAAPDTIQGHRQAQEITAYRGGVATQIPLGSISSINFKRQPVQDTQFAAAQHGVRGGPRLVPRPVIAGRDDGIDRGVGHLDAGDAGFEKLDGREPLAADQPPRGQRRKVAGFAHDARLPTVPEAERLSNPRRRYQRTRRLSSGTASFSGMGGETRKPWPKPQPS